MSNNQEPILPKVQEFVKQRALDIGYKPPPAKIYKPPMFSNMKTITGTDEFGKITVTLVDCSLVLIKIGDKFLGVSRRDNHNDIGLPGGKREMNESFEECAIRETLEETGYVIELIDTTPFYAVDSGYFCVTFLAKVTDYPPCKVDKSEGRVGRFEKQPFIDGSFGDYNVMMFKHFGI